MSNFLPDSSCYELLTIIGNTASGLGDRKPALQTKELLQFVGLFLIDCLFLTLDACPF